ncbi:MAG: hypothetical protein ACRDQ5_11000 [Sciscionella sp.]
MSQEHESTPPTGDLPEQEAQALSVLRNVWTAREQSSADIEEACGNTKSCKAMANVGFQGMVDGGAAPSDDTSVNNDLRAAWRNTLAREGKLDPEASSVRELIYHPSDRQQ